MVEMKHYPLIDLQGNVFKIKCKLKKFLLKQFETEVLSRTLQRRGFFTQKRHRPFRQTGVPHVPPGGAGTGVCPQP